MSEYAIVAPEDFDQSVFRLIGKEWMLVTAKNQEGKVNTMTASWGGLGVMWGKNVAVTVLRPQRYTKEFIDQSESFTLSFYDDTFKKDLSYLGSVSGRDEDKIAKTRLTPTDANGIPFFEEAKIVLICKKLYSQPMDPEGFVDKSLDEQWYPEKDYHVLYAAEIEQILVEKIHKRIYKAEPKIRALPFVQSEKDEGGNIMAESMSGLARSHRCTEVSNKLIGTEVTVMGWVQKRRNLGSLIFVDLRDRSGILQLVFDQEVLSEEDYNKANSLRSEYVVAAVGTVEKRSAAINENLKTGDIEIKVHTLRILSESETPPFPIDENQTVKDELRLKYRYLDLRRPNLQRNLRIRNDVTRMVRNFLGDEGFLEIETPVLGKSTPEGARDYLVPSRVHPGEFYGLPQSPQLFKQLLMCSGFDRYYQIAKCFRDEDLRADRQPEFTQIDMELSFVDVDDVIDVNERLLKKIFKEVLDIDVQLPMLRMTYKEAMDRFGSDKPDMRFGMELTNVSDTVAGCDFMVFKGALENGGSVRGLNAKGLGDLGRKKIDGFVDYAKDFGAKGLAYIQLKSDGTVKSSFAKFMKEEEMDALIKAMDGQAGDLLLFAADKDKVVFDVLGNLRLHIAKQYDMIDKSQYKFLWVTEFPLLEWSDEQNRYTAMHHPFTMPFEEDLEFIDERPGDVRAKAYDIVLNGTELGGGSIRIHQDDIQEKMFEALGFTKEDAHNRFGFLLDAFKFGVPPHAGLAYGLDRLVMWLTGEDSIRDVIAFPKVKDASCLMTQAPGPVDTLQLEELGIELLTPEEE